MVSFYAGGSGIFPMGWNGGPLPIHGSKVLLDSDSDTYIISDTDDAIQFFAAGSEIAEFDATSIDFVPDVHIATTKKLTLDADLDTYIVSGADDEIQFFAGGAEIVEFDATAVTIVNGTELVISDDTASTSATTGALQVAGGLGVADDIFAGTDVTAGDRMVWGGDAAQSTARAKTQNKQDMGTGLEEILDTASISAGMGGMAIVCGKKTDDSAVNFVDIILFGDAAGSTVTTVSSANVQGSPDNRAYDMNVERKVRGSVAANTYNINVMAFGMGNPA